MILKKLSICVIAITAVVGFQFYAAQQAANKRITTTPIEHLVVIFGENESFDHYFGTYPKAVNPDGDPPFKAAPRTPAVNGLTDKLLHNNPNFTNAANEGAATNPFRLDRSQAATSSQNHAYKPQQQAFNNGAMDLFPKYTGIAGRGGTAPFNTKGLVMGYYDGNTVTALWNYAQRFAMNDNSFGTTFGPSSLGAINLISGQTNGVVRRDDSTSMTGLVDDGQGGLTLTGDLQPAGDLCSTGRGSKVSLTGRNIGDLLNEKGVSWGWFQGGFDLTRTNPDDSMFTACRRRSYSPVWKTYRTDYVAHHQPFQYYASTANLKHTRPRDVASIGSNDDGGANHQYDLEDFYAAVEGGRFPAVTFLKAASFQDGHPGLSDPLDEQTFLVIVLNFLQKRPEWKNTAVILAYDDSDGWYDHVSKVVHPSTGTSDAFSGADQCGSGASLPGVKGMPVNGRCGFGPRLPLLVISPFSKVNFVDHTLTDQTSILRFIEDNWLGGKRIGQGSFDAKAGSLLNMFNFKKSDTRTLILDPDTGLPKK